MFAYTYIKYFHNLKLVAASEEGKWLAGGQGQEMDFYLLNCEPCEYTTYSKSLIKFCDLHMIKLKLDIINTNELEY